MDTIPILLRQVFLFQRLDDALLALLAQQVRRRRFGPGEALFHQGDPGHTLYLVLDGRVRIQKITASGDVVHLAHRGPGAHFGELALLDDKPRMADAVTATSCDLLMLGRDEFVRCVHTSPPIGLAVMAALAERLREAASDLETRHELDVMGRLAAALLDLADAHGAADPSGGVRLDVRVTHQDLADQIGATRESVSRAMAGLRQVRALRTEGRTLILLNLPKLRRQSGR